MVENAASVAECPVIAVTGVPVASRQRQHTQALSQASRIAMPVRWRKWRLKLRATHGVGPGPRLAYVGRGDEVAQRRQAPTARQRDVQRQHWRARHPCSSGAASALAVRGRVAVGRHVDRRQQQLAQQRRHSTLPQAALGVGRAGLRYRRCGCRSCMRTGCSHAGRDPDGALRRYHAYCRRVVTLHTAGGRCTVAGRRKVCAGGRWPRISLLMATGRRNGMAVACRSMRLLRMIWIGRNATLSTLRKQSHRRRLVAASLSDARYVNIGAVRRVER